MAALDPRVTVQDVANYLDKEKRKAEEHHSKEKDEENRAYLSGQLDFMERLEAFLTV